MATKPKMTSLNLLNACDEVHKLIIETNVDKLPPNTTRRVIFGATDYEIDDDHISEMRSYGKSFAWCYLDKKQPPCLLIDFQNIQTQIIRPPFMYVATPDFVSLVTTNGLYINKCADGKQLWTKKYKIDVDERGNPYYQGKPLSRLTDDDGIIHKPSPI